MKKYNTFIVMIFLLPILILAGTVIHADMPINLNGMVAESVAPVFTAEKVYDGSFQNEVDNWYRDRFPLRKLFVKINNQFSYYIHACINTDIVVGKKGWLYSTEYISTSLEEISENDKKIYDDYVKNVKKMQDNLEESGKKFIYIITPSKTEMYPEFLPYRFSMIRKAKDNITNKYDYLLQRLKEENVNYIDAKSILLQEAGDIPYFSKTGIHWNYYAAAVCAEQAIKQLNYWRDISIETLPIDKPYGTEQDIYALTNIFRGITDENYYQVALTCQSISERDKKKAVEMGTSFSGELSAAFGANRDLIFSELVRYQYFAEKTIYRDDVIADYRTAEGWQDDLKNEIANADIVILENNNSYVPESHFEFADYVSALSPDQLAEKQYAALENEGITIDFSADGNGDEYIEYGFYDAEEQGRWAEACAEISILLNEDRDLILDFSQNRFAEDSTIKFNDQVIWISEDKTEALSNLIVPKELICKKGKNYITISTETEILSPKEQGISEDERRFAHWIDEIKISVMKEEK